MTTTSGGGGGSTPTLVQDVTWGTNNGGLTGRYWYFHLPQPTLSGNLLICGVSWDTAATATITDNIGTNTWVNGPTSNDGTRHIMLKYVLGVAAGTQDLTLTLSAAEYNVHFHCSEFYNVATSSAVDGTATSASNITGPTVASGSITTTTDGDLIYYYGVDDAGFCCTAPVTSYVVGSNFNLLGSVRLLGHFAQYQVQATHGAINPTMTVNQSSHDAFGSAAIALKAASAGTAPSGIRIVHEFVFSPPNSGSSITEQFPCSGNLFVTTGSTNATQFDVTGITDSDSNTYTRWNATGYPQILYKENATCANPNTRTVTVSYTDHGSPDPLVFYDVAGAAASAYDSTMGVAQSTGNQTSKAASNTTCANNANYNTSASGTPSTASGIIFVVENNGTGPECGMSGTGNVFDSVWFQTEDDSCCGMLNSSSGYGHIPYSSAAQQTATFNWANSAAAGASSYGIAMAAFKAP